MAKAKSEMETVVKNLYERISSTTNSGQFVFRGCTVYWSVHQYTLTLNAHGDDGLRRSYRRPKGYSQLSMVLWAFFCTWVGKLSHKKRGYTGSTQIR